ncbi:hypothetical protein ACFO1B_32040 [Dactylosporangium siamense]|uniref:Uncharacterized protein n=1 Tax=Dactylosporangium siamense TaxID=685454 RepID=A0A919PQY2_9ACTN|nr:hypothetical protein [Dactylosporangium siamense]GIG48607.1 hypothetical protein Dsi01nite_066480 [Dactylosporangium siamense]
MNDEEASRLLERLADHVPVRPVPTEALLRGGRAARRGQRRLNVVAATAAVAVVLGGGVAARGLWGGSGDLGQAPPATPSPATSFAATPYNPITGRTGALPEGGIFDCVERYSPETVATRAFAFDGVVAAIGPARSNRPDMGQLDLVAVTFTVGEWFAGGSEPNAVVDMYPAVNINGTAAWAIGSRLLVSGGPRWGGAPLDAAIAWPCGFTRYYDPETAKSWRR